MNINMKFTLGGREGATVLKCRCNLVNKPRGYNFFIAKIENLAHFDQKLSAVGTIITNLTKNGAYYAFLTYKNVLKS